MSNDSIAITGTSDQANIKFTLDDLITLKNNFFQMPKNPYSQKDESALASLIDVVEQLAKRIETLEFIVNPNPPLTQETPNDN